MDTQIRECVACARNIFRQRYADATAMFLAGSYVRGQQTKFSDLDLVVVFDRLPAAYRESFRFERFPVEVFVHDPQTMHYFFHHVERDSARPSLAQMISEGIEIPTATTQTDRLKATADRFLSHGPPRWDIAAINGSRYAITDAVDDLRDPASDTELYSTAGELAALLATHYFRRNGLWCARGKSINRTLAQHNAKLASRFEAAFSQLYQHSETSPVIALAQDILRADGGWLFEGYRQNAPVEWRSSVADEC